MFTYPESALDQPDQILDQLGGFWSRGYGGRAQLLAFCEGMGWLTRDAHDRVTEAIACLASGTVPVYRCIPWLPVPIRQSQLSVTGSVPVYSGGTTYGSGIAYGQFIQSPNFTHPLPAGVVNVPWIFNRITDPSRSLAAGIDYTIADGEITFQGNPFTDPAWPSQPVYTGQTVSDYEIILWLYNAQADLKFVFNHFGYVLGLNLPSSQGYKELVHATLEALVTGPSATTLEAAISAVTGVPLAQGAETVEDVGYDNEGLLVITGANAYRFTAAAKPLVSIGEQVTAGQALSDALQIFELNTGQVPTGLASLATGPGVLGPGFLGDIVWQNTSVPITVKYDPRGNPRVSWPLGGFPADVEHFWDVVHSNGLASGNLLYNLLKAAVPAADPTRDRPYGRLGAQGIFSTINPLQFLVSNFLRNGTFIVQINAGALPADAIGLQALSVLRRVLSPYTAMLVVVNLPLASDAIIMDDVANPVTTLDTAETITESVTPSTLWDGPVISRMISRSIL